MGHCQQVTQGSGDRICSDSFDVAMGNNVSYTWVLPYEDSDYDVLVTLAPTSGDADLYDLVCTLCFLATWLHGM